MLFLTLTVRHHRGDGLADRLGAMANGLHDVLRGAPWDRRKRSFGFVGAVRAVEVTWGEANGWHPHMHAALVFRRALDDVEVDTLRHWLVGRWSSIVERRGFGTIDATHGVDVRRVTGAGDLGSYLTKVEGGWTAGHELARADLKSKGVTPFEMLLRLVDGGEKRWAMLWREYEAATLGRRAIVFSPGLRAELLEDQEQSDQALAASEGVDVALLRALVPRAVWHRRLDECTTAQLLDAIERHAVMLLVLCDVLGFDPPPIEGETEQSRVGSPGGREPPSAAEPGGVPLTARGPVIDSIEVAPVPTGA